MRFKEKPDRKTVDIVGVRIAKDVEKDDMIESVLIFMS